jgi:DNA repair exonuclease SbcCD ATPase subunit
MFSIEGENILSYKYIKFDFAKKGLTSITGVNEDNPMFSSNGCGKSSLLEILRWGVYGETSKGNNVDDIVNSRIGKDCWLQTEFGKYKIIRYRNHSKFKNDLQFFIDDVDNTGKSNKDTQKRIEHEIGLNHTSFIHSIYFAQNQLSNFASANDAKQKDIIENILGLNALSEAQQWCKDKIKEVSSGLSLKSSEISLKESQIRQIDARISELDAKSEKFEKLREAEKKNIFDNIAILESKKVTEPLVNIDKAQTLIELAESKQEEYDLKSNS